MRIPWFIPLVIGVILGGATGAVWVAWAGVIVGAVMLWYQSEA